MAVKIKKNSFSNPEIVKDGVIKDKTGMNVIGTVKNGCFYDKHGHELNKPIYNGRIYDSKGQLIHVIDDRKIYDSKMSKLCGEQKVETANVSGEVSSSAGQAASGSALGAVVAFLLIIAILIAPFITLQYLPGWGIALFFLGMIIMLYTVIDSIVQFSIARKRCEINKNKRLALMIVAICVLGLIYIIYSVSVIMTASGKTKEYLAAGPDLFGPLIAFMIMSTSYGIILLIPSSIMSKNVGRSKGSTIAKNLIITLGSIVVILTGSIGASTSKRNDIVSNKFDFEVYNVNTYDTYVALSYRITNRTKDSIRTFKSISIRVYSASTKVCDAEFTNVKAPTSLSYGDKFTHTFNFVFSKNQADSDFWYHATTVNLTTYAKCTY